MIKNVNLCLSVFICGLCFILAGLFFTSPGFSADEAKEPDPIERARKLGLKGQYQEAIRVYDKIIQEDTADFQARIELARIYLEIGKYDEAWEACDLVIKEEPENTEAQVIRAEVLFTRGRYAELKTLLDEILKSSPENLSARVLKAGFLLETGQCESAEKELAWFNEITDTEINKFGVDELLALARGLWLYGTRIGDKNIIHRVNDEILPLAEDLNKNNPALYTQWGFCYLEKGDIPAALDCFKNAFKVNPNYALAHLGQAYCNFSRDPTQAKPFIQKVLSINPDLAEAHNALAIIYIVNEQYPEALEESDKSLRVNPNSVVLHATLASIYYLNNDLRRFEAECKNILKINPKPAIFYYLLGSNLVRKMNYPEAHSFYKKAVELDPEFWEGYVALGLNCLKVGEEEEAKKLLEQVYERDPFNVIVYNTLEVLDVLEKEYIPVKTKHFTIKLHRDEKVMLEFYTTDLLERAYEQFTKLYKFEPEPPLLCDIMPNRADFSVRMAGVPGIDFALGVCFGKAFLAYSPSVQEDLGKRFHWGAVTTHEFVHVITLQLSKFRVPRWFTEGCSVYAEKQINPAWGRELEMQLYHAYEQGKIMRLKGFCEKKGFDLLHTYLFSSLIMEYIHKKYGMDKIIAMLKAFGERKKQSEVFQECLGKSIQEFDQEFFDYFENTWLAQIKIRKPVALKEEEALRQKIEKDEKDAEAWARLSRVSLIKDNLFEAQQQANKALELDAKNIEAHLTLAHLFFKKKRYQRVADYFTKAIRLGADDFGTHFTLGKTWFRQNEPEEAMKEFIKARECFPHYVKRNDNPYYYLAKIYDDQGETKKASDELADLVKIDHEDFSIRKQLAKIYRKEGGHDALIELLEETVYLEPENLSIHDWLGDAYLARKDYEGVLREYRIKVFLLEKLNPTEKRNLIMSKTWCDIAEIYLVRKDKVKARESVLKAQEIYPDNKRIEEILRECE